MEIDNGPLVHNSGDGTINVHGTVVGGNGNQVTVSQGSAASPGAAELLRVLTAIRLTATASPDLAATVQARLLQGAAEAQRLVAAGERDHACAVLIHARAELQAVPATAQSVVTLCTLLDSALDLLPE